MDEVAQRFVLHHHRLAPERRGRLFPTRDVRLPTPGKSLEAGTIGGRIRGVELLHPCGQRLADLEQVARVGLDVRIAFGMDIAIGTIGPRRHVEQGDKARSLEIPGLTRLDAGVARLAQHQRQPAALQLGAGGDDQVGTARTGDQRWPGLDAVRILQAVGGGEDRHLVATDFLGQGAPLGHGGEDIERRVGRQASGGKKGE